MTENEAINKLKQHFEYLKHAWKPHPDYETMDAIGYAISALETIKKLSDRKMTTEVLENYMQFEDECVKKGFTFKSVIEAREKQIAKKPTYEGDGYDYCPSCGQKLDLDRDEQPTAFSMGAKLIDNFVNPFEIKAGGNS
jgi:hypothetical protein|nr:MAG TPA: zinc-ribbon containing domain protein [Bacteriophage sp.]